MTGDKWTVGQVAFQDRMPPLAADKMNEAQRKAAAELTAGPRKGVKGPFIPLIRSPELMERLQKVGEYLRFQSALEPRISEFIMLIVSREWTQQFEWAVHVPLGRKVGLKDEVIEALAGGRRPATMRADEEIVYDFCEELLRTKGVSDATYRRTVKAFGENGVVDIVGILGYFTTVSMVLNVAHTPPDDGSGVKLLSPFPF
ncbi:MAG TPA: carboxymuconolactone decarboxylase family protein [Burkholderiales bacterium]|nr:carboxymuconolactone decarboxylase family protein [Burkholderiales bacterium]